MKNFLKKKIFIQTKKKSFALTHIQQKKKKKKILIKQFTKEMTLIIINKKNIQEIIF
jgi:hypothetical protein